MGGSVDLDQLQHVREVAGSARRHLRGLQLPEHQGSGQEGGSEDRDWRRE
jgi:hypothetical protein